MGPKPFARPSSLLVYPGDICPPQKATKCHSLLDDMIDFPKLKMKLSRSKIVVTPGSSQAKPKSKLHDVWFVAENVLEELQNYQAICELGSKVGAVEEVDLLSLDTKDIVRFKVHFKSVAMIPPIIEVGVQPFLYDIFLKIDSIIEEGWNDDSINLGKRASVERHGFDDHAFEKYGKAKNEEDFFGMDNMLTDNIGKFAS
jgi:hypothetical protein